MKQCRLRIGVARLGRAFSLMLPTFLRGPGVQLAAACDPREEARQQFVADFDTRTYADVRDLAGDPDVEVIYMINSHQFRVQHTKIAVANGKHVLVEKSVVPKAANCDHMIAAHWAINMHLVVGHCHSFDTPYLHTRDLTRSDDFGAVKMIQALNCTGYLYRSRRSEELMTAGGGGAVFGQATHQADIVRVLAGSHATHLRMGIGRWDSKYPTEDAYSVLIQFENDVYASLSYSRYGRFNSGERMGWISEVGDQTGPDAYGAARRRLVTIVSSNDGTQLKATGTYSGVAHKPPSTMVVKTTRHHQHFGLVIVTYEHVDLRPLPDPIIVYDDHQREVSPLSLSIAPRGEVIDELYETIIVGRAPLHNSGWARGTLEACIAILGSSETGKDASL